MLASLEAQEKRIMRMEELMQTQTKTRTPAKRGRLIVGGGALCSYVRWDNLSLCVDQQHEKEQH